jgi:hypothetical protein
MCASKKLQRRFHKTKEAGSSASGLSDPRHVLVLEDPHNNGPQEYKDTAYGEKLQLSQHGSLPLSQ